MMEDVKILEQHIERKETGTCRNFFFVQRKPRGGWMLCNLMSELCDDTRVFCNAFILFFTFLLIFLALFLSISKSNLIINQ
jgi:hypothetical protein